MEAVLNKKNYKQTLSAFQSLIALFILCVVISIMSDKFLTTSNLWNVMRQISVNIKKIKIAVYTIAGLLAAVGGILVTSRLDAAQPNAGTGYELDSIAAVVIGGTSLSGGKGSVLGTVLGAIIIGVLNNGLVLLNVSPFWQQVVKGFVILIAVIIDKMNREEEG